MFRLIITLTLLLSINVFCFTDSLGLSSSMKNKIKLLEKCLVVHDSLNFIPAFTLYGGFDRNKIWSVKVDQTKKVDTTALQLLHDSCDFHSPRIGKLTSGYGWRNNHPHYGVDIKLNTGDSVRSVFDGMVRISRYSSSYGHVVVVRHNNGLETLYAHLSQRLVKERDEVTVGQLIGLGGNTGRSYGSHLHFETRYLGAPINPKDIFNINDSTFDVRKDSLFLSPETFFFLKEVRRVKHHKVRSGDSLWRISKRYSVPISKLCRLNTIDSNKTLRIGERIRYN